MNEHMNEIMNLISVFNHTLPGPVKEELEKLILTNLKSMNGDK